MPKDIICIEGIAEEIIYSNYANGYTVCVLDSEGEMVTATGCMPYLAEGESVKLSGRWINHPEYGRQFSVVLYEKTSPKTADAILRYLASGIIKGIRLATAKKIVDTFGDDSLNILLNEPTRLSEISGISRHKAIEIGEEYARQQGMSELMMFLQQYGIGTQTALKVYRRFGSGAVKYIKDDPYVLSDDINGISFKTADRIAYTMGIRAENLSRLKAGIKYILSYNAQSSGHTYLPFDSLVATGANMLGVSEDEVQRALYALSTQNSVVLKEICGETGVFLMNMFDAESYICKKSALMASMSALISQKEAESLVLKWEQSSDIELADEQRSAVICTLSSHIMILTGGPGTGKTTIVNTIIEILAKKGLSVALAAPTGRAAKRMSELTGKEAKTIHRLLEISYSDDSGLNVFSRDESYPLQEDFIIVDECSMVDVLLAHSLMKAIKPSSHIIMVGDADQLPPVGAGNMLSDLIESGKIKTVRLTKIFRQASVSMIVQNSHRIINGQNPILNEPDSDFYFVPRTGNEQIASCVADLCKNRLSSAYGYDPLQQIQVLSSMKKGICGVKNLNSILQNSLNPPSPDKAEHKSGENIFRTGDRVMQTKNNYDIVWENTITGESGCGIFNGDMGFVENIDSDNRHISIIFDDKRVLYGFDALDELDLSYAVTVHKSQGSEFDVVVMPVYNAAPMLMKRNLLYTALTRAKKLVVLVGTESAIQTMVASDSEKKRFTAIKYMMGNEGI